MSYVGKRSYKENWQSPARTHGPAWGEPLTVDAPRTLALAALEHALNIDLKNPRRAVSAFLFIVDVLPATGPAARRRLLPKAIEQVERLLRGEVTGTPARYGRKLQPHHQRALARLIAQHKPATA